ncbi:hypothetical protein ATO8_02640 [Roseivivax marinus]|uniref:AlgX/AlgJ SGNH hydrolase-like domain-containing protein n=1 Tax=Roseivivax marinus TaxID=1379903 RepID=W4HPZ7_9RHOB|nr:hypothetical protein [Roseivivax marinus]ETW14769.1 hypothetical protein ATO8_02640 [Roseivivax marinus]UMA66003.1 hypothetical protein LVO79_06030 [Roseivivax marinus]
MQTVLFTIRHALPILFLGYAALVNAEIFLGEDGLGGSPEGDIVTGGRTASIDGLYSEALPHRGPAVSLIGAGRYLLIGEGRSGVTVGSDDWLFTDEEMTPADASQLETALAQASDVRDRLAELGTELVVVPVPAKVDVYRDRGPTGAGAVMQAQYDAFRTGLEARDIASVDTRPALMEARGDAPVFLTSDTHWTPEGARLVAGTVAASGLVPQGDTAFEKTPARPEEFVGDLVSFVTSDGVAPFLGIAPERVTPYVAEEPDAASGGIFAAEAEAVDTILVGTSYSANDNWSFVPALKIALGRDILNLAQEGRGPVAPMDDFLADPALEREAPDTVIWEYPVRYLGVADEADAPVADADATDDTETLNG